MFWFRCIDETLKPRQEVKPTTLLTLSLSLAFFLILCILREANMRDGKKYMTKYSQYKSVFLSLEMYTGQIPEAAGLALAVVLHLPRER